MKKIFTLSAVLIIIISWFLNVIAAPSEIQTWIWDVSWNTTVIPDSVINSFNSNYSGSLPSGTTVGEAYSAWYLSDGTNGPITDYVSGLGDTASNTSSLQSASSWLCDYNGGDIWYELDGCLWNSTLVSPWDGLIESWVKNKIVYWTNQLAMLLGLLAVWAIVYWALMMTISVWEDEKIKKWKDIVKWAMLWFLGLLVAWWLVRVVIEIMFSVAS